jgi:hypothetical protein
MGPSGITFEEFKRLELLAANQIHAVMSVREGHDSHVKEFVMSKRTNHIPPALKHGIYSGFGLLPTEDQAEFQKFKQEIFDEYVPVGRSERNIVENMACKMWRRQNLFTYCLAKRARDRDSAIYAKLSPPPMFWSSLRGEETRSAEELEALRKRADERARVELGAAIELVEIGEVATFEYMEKELAMIERLDAAIARDQKSLLYVRGIKSMLSGAVAPSQPRLGKAA